MEADTEVSRKLREVSYQLEVTNEELAEAREVADWVEWQLEQACKQFQYDILKAKETLRAEMQQMHARDLDARDELIAMLKAKLAESSIKIIQNSTQLRNIVEPVSMLVHKKQTRPQKSLVRKSNYTSSERR